MLDVGFCAGRQWEYHQTIVEGNLIFEEFKGAMTEQYVGKELMQIKGGMGILLGKV